MSTLPVKSQYVSWKFRLVSRHNVVVPFKSDEFDKVFRETLRKVITMWVINLVLFGSIFGYLVIYHGLITSPGEIATNVIAYVAYVSMGLLGIWITLTGIVAGIRFTKYVAKTIT